MSLDPHRAGLYPLHDPDWRRKLRHAGWLLLLPVLGWPMLLGYRRAQVEHFFDDRPRAMPEWSGHHTKYLADGLRAVLVIQGYTAPISLALAALVLWRGYVPGTPALLILSAFLVAPLFSNFALPGACVAFATPLFGRAYLQPLESAALLMAFTGAIFLVPAGFLRVTWTGRFLAAFDLGRSLPFIARHRRAYLRAWYQALWMNWTVPFALPVAPWGVFWGYVASVALFNQLLLAERGAPAWQRPRRGGWLEREVPGAELGDAEHFALDRAPSADGPARVLRTPWFSLPLP